MPAVKCGVNGCGAVLQPLLKPDLKDRTTWIYPECDLCSRPVCEQHASEVDGQVVCGRCLENLEAERRLKIVHLDERRG
jgi:hypothetical protein